MARFNHDLLRAMRLDLGMSQDEAARTLGVDVRTYRRYESGTVNEGGSFEIRNASRRRLIRRMCEELGVADEDAWLVPGEAVPERRTIGHALQRAHHFVGREETLARLAEWLEDERARVLVVVAPGGHGKTALVERFSSTVARAETWSHSFYEDPRTEAVVEELSKAGDRLAILDGIEVLQSEGGEGHAFGELEDPALRRVLRAACAGLSKRKVLVTSRMPLSDLAAWEGEGLTTLPLAALPIEDAKSLLVAWGLRGSDASLGALCERTGGHPLSLAMLGSYVGTFFDGDATLAASIPEDATADDPIARRLASVLDAYANVLAEQERELLARLSLFAGAADVPLLVTITNAGEPEVLRAIARLDRLGLVSRTPRGVVAHPFVRDHFKKLLGVPARDAHGAMRDALGASLEGKPVSRVRDPELLDRYESLFTHTRLSGRASAAWGIYERALGGFGNLGLRLGAMARGARVLASFAERTGGGERSPDALDRALSPETRASILYDWALYAGALGDLDLAARCHDAHLRALGDVRDGVARSLRAMGLRTRAYVAWLAGRVDSARSLLGASTELAHSLEDERGSHFHLSRAWALWAMVEHDAGDDDAASRALAEARDLERTPTARRGLWEAEIRLARGEKEAARSLAEAAMIECAKRGWLGHVAHAQTVLGLTYVGDDPVVAKAHLDRATPWVHASNEVEMALRCHHLAAEVARAEGRVEQAAISAATGLGLIATHGFVRFARFFRAADRGP